MSFQGRLLIIVVGLGLVVLIINLVRTHKLYAGYALVWLSSTLVAMILVTFPPLLELLTQAVGAIFPASALSLLAFIFMFVVLIFISVHLSKIAAKQVEIAQYLALKEEREQEERTGENE